MKTETSNDTKATGQGQWNAPGFAFPNGLLGVHHERGPVRVLAYGDIPGNSPSFLCVDGQGTASWYSMKDIQVIDPAALPLNVAGITGAFGGVARDTGNYDRTAGEGDSGR
jgi:hypothetical protein